METTLFYIVIFFGGVALIAFIKESIEKIIRNNNTKIVHKNSINTVKQDNTKKSLI